MKLSVAIGKRTGFTEDGQPKLGRLTKPKRETTWAKLVAGLSKFTVTDDKGSPGFLVGGWFEGKRRVADALAERQLVILDIDYLDSWDALEEVPWEFRERGIASFCHSTWSHTTDNPRLRMLIPLDRPVTREEYEPIARRLASYVGIDRVDAASFKWNQLMYLPAHPEGVEPVILETEGSPADTSEILASYVRWEDFDEWPRAAVEDKAAAEHVRAAKDPYKAPGVIGAFNRVYSVTHAIQEFGLPYEPAAGDRWMYTDGEGNPGALIYDNYGDACFLFSNHTDDPARGNNTAWDLVRVHRFGELDAQYDGPIGKAPSQQAMHEFVVTLDPVAEELAADEFEDLGPGEDEKPRKQRSFDRLMGLLVDMQSDDNPRKAARDMISSIAASRLAPFEEEELIQNLQAGWPGGAKMPIGALRDSVKAARKRLRQGGGVDEDQHMDIEEDLIAEFLSEHFANGDHLRRIGRQYWVFDQGLWRRAEDDWIYGRMTQTFLRLRKESPQDVETLVAAVGESKTSALAGSLCRMLDRLTSVKNEGADPLHLLAPRPAVINCLNGELHFERDGTFEFTDHHPELFLTSQVPVNYDPEAKCPEWDRFCGLIFADSLEPDEMQRHLEELGGYIIQYTRWLKAWVLFHGYTNAGKTTIGKVLERLLGTASANRALNGYDGANAHAEAGLVGKLMLLDEDFAKGELLPDGFLKKVSEEKTITANPKNKDEFGFVCRSLPVVISNHWPPTRDRSDAFTQRAVVFDFPHAIPAEERDDERAQAMLEDELPGILVRFVQGFSRLRARDGWDQPADCLEARETWLLHTNVVRLFVEEVMESGPSYFAKRSDLYTAYKDWIRYNEGGRALRKHAFLDQARGIFGEESKRNGHWGFVGHRIRQGLDFDD